MFNCFVVPEEAIVSADGSVKLLGGRGSVPNTAVGAYSALAGEKSACCSSLNPIPALDVQPWFLALQALQLLRDSFPSSNALGLSAFINNVSR